MVGNLSTPRKACQDVGAVLYEAFYHAVWVKGQGAGVGGGTC